ncbi:hypothetical protein P3342_010725 [Pyrenophora teres f. teres]|nr:hypothetical protein P3342_010725 [Pyrenophora teres f. teres]
MSVEDPNTLKAVRSKSLSAIPQSPSASLESRVRKMSLDQPDMTGIPPIEEDGGEVQSFPDREPLGEMDKNALVMVATADSEGEREKLVPATTANSHIDRHDMYPSMGRIETKDIRDVAHMPGQ